MSKKQNKKNTSSAAPAAKPTFVLSEKTQYGLAIAGLILAMVFLLKPFVIDGLSAQGVDVLGSLGKTHQITEYNKHHDDRALWNPSLFAGMPVYHRIGPQAWSVDNLLGWLARWFSTVFMYYILGIIGFFVLARYLGMPIWVSALGALLFVLMPHYKSLYLEGHMSKLKALMFLPWIFVSFRYFINRRNLLGMALFALAFGLQIRTQHYQIVFYSAMLVFALGVYPFIKDLMDKQWLRFGRSLGLLAVALILALAMAAQPLFLAKEYLPYSKRGKTTVAVNDKSGASAGKGVSLEYATQWSTAPSEILTWLVPRFYGGMSAETYTGTQYPQLKGRQIPGYWGHMPFTQSYEYMGVLLLLLAIWGFAYKRQSVTLRSLLIFAVFLILLSLGRHFSMFYGLFFDYFPFFNKFRTPMMSVTVTYFVFVLFAMYGVQYLFELFRSDKPWKEQKLVLYSLGGFAVLGLLIWLYGAGSEFIKAGGEPYQGQTLDMIRNIRQEYFNGDVLRYFVLLILGGGLILAALMKKVPPTIALLVLGVICVADLVLVQGRMYKDYKDLKKIERRYFQQTATDRYLHQDNEIFRVFPVGKLFTDNRWAYHHQSIGGYSPIKMYTIEELVEKNIYNGYDRKLPINWNVLKILNVKYLVSQGRLESPQLEEVFSDAAGKLITYRFREALPRAFFVRNWQLKSDEIERLNFINSADFNPAQTAVLEQEPLEQTSAPDSAFARLTAFSPNKLSFDLYTDKQALLVISEVYYPPGWEFILDGTEVEHVYKTDHAVQSIVVPAGTHKLEMRFHPQSYFKYIRVAGVSVSVLYLIILLSLVMGYLRNRKVAV